MRDRRMGAALAVVALAQGACGGAARPAGSTAPAPASAPAPAPPPAPRPVGDLAYIHVCIVQDGELRLVRGLYHPATRDTTVDGRPFSAVYPDTAGYAAAAEWYIENALITLGEHRYIKYGTVRVVGSRELSRVGEYGGVPLFVHQDETTRPPEVIHVPVRPGCEFQTYMRELRLRGVRGD